MAAMLESNKTKIAKRVIEVFDYFDAESRSATVMDIVRRYNRPQSSTSELLASLVEMGLLYKDAASRSYSPTPRLATLGSSAQPELLRDGRLYCFMDRLAQSTRYGVALFGMVGTHVQIFRWSPGLEPLTKGIEGGASTLLSSSAAGLLLLSSLGAERARKTLWRLNAEADTDAKFDHAAMGEWVRELVYQRHATGDAGFVAGAKVTSVLLPRQGDERALALGVIYPSQVNMDAEALLATLNHGIAQSALQVDETSPVIPTPLVRAV
jgi:DNA-binding IclR family transcriptional regulator